VAKRFAIKLQVTDSEPELGIIWGFASVADLVDAQGDVIPQKELIRAVYQFMADYYAGAAAIKENHDSVVSAVLVESTLQLVGTRVAWYVGFLLLDPDLRKAAREGEISGFSIGGWYVSDEDEEEGTDGGD